MKRIIIILTFFGLPLLAQSAGNTGLSFLKMGFGARNISLGDNGAVFGDDVSAIFYNPARLAGESSAEVMLMHNEWIQGVRSEIFGAKFSLFGQNFAIGVNSTSIGDIEARTKPGDYTALLSANYFYGSIGTGFSIIDNLKLGFSVKYIYESILVDDANGMAVDFGAFYKIDERIFVSASFKNIGSMNKLKNEASELPQELRVGTGYKYDLEAQKIGITAGVEVQKYLKVNETHFNVGVEGVYDDTFALRLGWQTFYESKSFTGGIGIYWANLTFDYALSPFRYDLGSGHTVSLKFRF